MGSLLKLYVILELVLFSKFVVSYDFCSNQKEEELCGTGRRHIACYPESLPMKGQYVAVAPMTFKLMRTVLHTLNTLRSDVASGNFPNLPIAAAMREFNWNNELEYIAIQHVKRCNAEEDECHNSPNFKNSGEFSGVHGSSEMPNVTVTLADILQKIKEQPSSLTDPSELTRTYTAEHEKSAHDFALIINDQVSKIGCALAYCRNCEISDGNTEDHCFFLSCVFEAANVGNCSVYMAGSNEAAESCDIYDSEPSSNYKGLCSNNGKFYPNRCELPTPPEGGVDAVGPPGVKPPIKPRPPVKPRPPKTTKKPGPAKPGAGKPVTAKPGADKPGADKPGADKPGADKPGADKPGADKPGSDKPGADKPGADKPGADKPGADKPGADKPVTAKPGAAKPVTSKPEPAKTTKKDNKKPDKYVENPTCKAKQEEMDRCEVTAKTSFCQRSPIYFTQNDVPPIEDDKYGVCKLDQKKICFEAPTHKNFICDFANELPSLGDPLHMHVFDDYAKQFSLDLHNRKRNEVASGRTCGSNLTTKEHLIPPASRMREIIWDDELEWFAQKHARQCHFEHDKCHNSENYRIMGQNLGVVNTGRPTGAMYCLYLIETHIYNWYFEKDKIKGRLPIEYVKKFEGKWALSINVGHFATFMVDAISRMGCASVFCDNIKKGKSKGGQFTCCHYDFGTFEDSAIYKIGPPTSECQSSYKIGVSKKYPYLCAAGPKPGPYCSYLTSNDRDVFDFGFFIPALP